VSIADIVSSLAYGPGQGCRHIAACHSAERIRSQSCQQPVTCRCRLEKCFAVVQPTHGIHARSTSDERARPLVPAQGVLPVPQEPFALGLVEIGQEFDAQRDRTQGLFGLGVSGNRFRGPIPASIVPAGSAPLATTRNPRSGGLAAARPVTCVGGSDRC